MSKKTSDHDILQHLAASRGHKKMDHNSHRQDTGGIILHTPPTGPNESVEQMLAREASTETHRPSLHAETGLNDEDNKIIEIPCDLVDDSPYQNPFRDYDPIALDELAGGMESAGQNEPIQVRRKGNRYELLAGHRRIRAARLKGWTAINAIIFECDDAEALKKVVTHNEGRKNDSPFAQGHLYQFALDRGLGNQAKIATLFATNTTHVSRCLSMLRLPRPIVSMLEKQSDLFGIKTAEIINQLLADHPTEEALIIQAVERIKKGAPSTSVKGWFEQMYKQKEQKTGRSNNRTKVVTSANGRQLFSAKRDGRVITVRVSDSEVDADAAMMKVIESLKIFSTENYGEK
ncbi:ParB/RepB/Spo0J family partition protein [Massilia genomosp. 1]|uniref:ParB/RepB/Spo0J family partition protein n=1 Tax=Massilia genomosp. 1 TaxID=2609280 RepID=A0ABX0N1W3_9BURK|nr:ParB/RepB/Spo0J family partition protein [Massilia genomosp. 1]NHZ65872.1 ParB/RepB/Spo0J family partition protein [Massilia genomosp. 1]